MVKNWGQICNGHQLVKSNFSSKAMLSGSGTTAAASRLNTGLGNAVAKGPSLGGRSALA